MIHGQQNVKFTVMFTSFFNLVFRFFIIIVTITTNAGPADGVQLFLVCERLNERCFEPEIHKL
jgi:hypothetical protein